MTNAAWRMKHKLMQVMMERDHPKKLSGFIELDDACLGGEHSGGKRGPGAAGKTPFAVAAQDRMRWGKSRRRKTRILFGQYNTG